MPSKSNESRNNFATSSLSSATSKSLLLDTSMVLLVQILYLMRTSARTRPYQDEASFNEAMIIGLKDTTTGGCVDTVCDMVAALKDHEIILTHGDISPRNIIVQGSKVVAILDWEMAGFYPEYWEYAKALYRPAWESDWIKDKAVNTILEPYLTELAVSLHINSIGGW
jgi:hypothetical protein